MENIKKRPVFNINYDAGERWMYLADGAYVR